jgi:hypothetical protein
MPGDSRRVMKNFTFVTPLAVKQWFQPTLIADEITAIFLRA